MEANVEEALKAKEIAERRFTEKDFASAKNYALKAKGLCPGLEGISQMVATFEVYIASEIKCNGGIDYYSVLGLKPSADRDAVKRQYKKLAVLLHPDKNKTVGADGAFKLVSEAWTMLSDSLKRRSHDLKRNKQLDSCAVQKNLSSVHSAGVAAYNNCSNLPTSHGLDSFWTVCTSCKVQYEYLRKYVNKRLSCKNCRGTFIATETGTAPVNGSFPYGPWPYVPTNGYANHGYDGAAFVPANATFFRGNGVPNLHSPHGYEYASSVPFQWNSFSGTSTGVVSHSGASAVSADVFYQVNGNVGETRAKVKSAANGQQHSMKSTGLTVNSNLSSSESSYSMVGAPNKKRQVVGANLRNGPEEKRLKPASDAGSIHGTSTVEHDSKLSSPNEPPMRRSSIAPAFDARKLLMDKARNGILKKLEEMRITAAAVKENAEDKSKKQVGSDVCGRQSKPNRNGPVSITVPDPDFHDFDEDRSEECFKPKQIWAIYDEDDGMPRLYCLIRQVLSVDPFKIHITYLNSKTDSEFGSVNWIDSGFTKSCGHFRAWNSDVIDQVNIFSHVLKGEKAGRGGCVRIFPKSGDIWAVYQNWSPDWNRLTPDDVRHQYEMVEVLEDYSEELGVCVTPLIKLAGFKTVYQRNPNKGAIRWIPRREMFRFSHQVPSSSLEGEACNLPYKCWDLDPAATPDELLCTITDEVKA
uniref:J domain-containing protein n=1 Tax=Rhizophora mucronata TaxID=61149 RepID=A0A2P2LK42_RHIMU